MLEARAGNRESADRLVQRNFGRIYRYIARLVGGQGPVEDLTQDVFLHALGHAQQYQPTARVATWLYRIATNVGLNHLKRPSVTRRVSNAGDGPFDVPDRRATSPERALSVDELRYQVTAAIRELPDRQRVALTLFEYEECSYEQIAAVLEVSIEGIRSLLMRARAALRERLEGLV